MDPKEANVFKKTDERRRLVVSAQQTLKKSHLLDLRRHVAVDDFHVGVGRLHQDFDQHLGLLRGETLGDVSQGER